MLLQDLFDSMPQRKFVFYKSDGKVHRKSTSIDKSVQHVSNKSLFPISTDRDNPDWDPQNSNNNSKENQSHDQEAR